MTEAAFGTISLHPQLEIEMTSFDPGLFLYPSPPCLELIGHLAPL